jgi:hypothetical protein
MKGLSTLLILFMIYCACAYGQHIETRVLRPDQAMRLTIHPNIATTLLFPSPVAGTFGLGLVSQSQGKSGNESTPAEGVVQMDHPDGSPVMVLHALTDTAKVMMTVILESRLYVFNVEAGQDPDVAITFVKDDPQAPRAQEVTENDVREQQLKCDPELLVGYLRRARDAELLLEPYPDLYKDYGSRTANYRSESEWAITNVTKIHHFSDSDVTVLEGTVENKLGKPLVFDPRSTTVQVANEVHPAKLVDVQQPVAAGKQEPIAVVLQGEWDASRAHLSIRNEYRIILPVPIKEVASRYQAQETGKGAVSRFRVPQPEGKQAIPRTQTGP